MKFLGATQYTEKAIVLGLSAIAGLLVGLALMMYSYGGTVTTALFVLAAFSTVGMIYTGYWNRLEVVEP